MKNNKTKQISILIPDGEIHVIMYVVNCFSLIKNVKIYVMSSVKNNHMKYSRLIENFIYYPLTNQDEWINHINFEVDKNNIDLILPIYEMGIKTIVENIEKINEPNKLCELPDIESLNSARNKGLLYLHLKENQIPCPNTLIVKPNSLVNLEDFSFPVIIKPVEGGGGGVGVEIVENKEQVLSYYKTNQYKCDTIVQEFIQGCDFCCNALCKEGDLIAFSIQKGTVYRDGILTPQISFDFIENKELIESTKILMKSLNWSGIVNIDWRYDENEKVFKVIEINTRFWLSTDASSIAGVNFPYLYCLSSLGKKIELQNIKPMSYLSLEGLARSFKKNPFFIFRFNYIYHHSPIRFIIKDPLPLVFKSITILKKKYFKAN